jgi:tetratricopeptide (TPR) repeat protein
LKKALLVGALLAALAVSAPAAASEVPDNSTPPIPGVSAPPSDPLQTLQDIMRLAQTGKEAEAKAALEQFVKSDAFRRIPADKQLPIRGIYLQTLLESGRAKEAYPEIKSVTDAGTDTTGNFWYLRMWAAEVLHEDADSLDAFTVLAKRWPERLRDFNDEYVYNELRASRNKGALRARRTAAMLALYESGWKPQNVFAVTDGQRLGLAMALLDEGKTDKAREVTATITYPKTIGALRMQRRFDGVISAVQSQQDLARASDARTETVRSQVSAAPDKLAGANALAAELYNRGRLEEALAVVDEAIARAEPANGGKTPFTDMEELRWSYDRRAQILLFLGRGDEAVAAMKTGAARLEHGVDNVSQTLNLGEFYVLLGRPREALDLVEPVGSSSVSGYGRMVREGIRASAYALLHDEAKLKEPLDYLKAHRTDSPTALLDALVAVGDDEGAAREIVALLADPDWRAITLEDLQDYIIPNTAPSSIKARDARLRAVRERPDVKAAIAPYGRVLSLPFLVAW